MSMKRSPPRAAIRPRRIVLAQGTIRGEVVHRDLRRRPPGHRSNVVRMSCERSRDEVHVELTASQLDALVRPTPAPGSRIAGAHRSLSVGHGEGICVLLLSRVISTRRPGAAGSV